MSCTVPSDVWLRHCLNMSRRYVAEGCVGISLVPLFVLMGKHVLASQKSAIEEAVDSDISKYMPERFVLAVRKNRREKPQKFASEVMKELPSKYALVKIVIKFSGRRLLAAIAEDLAGVALAGALQYLIMRSTRMNAVLLYDAGTARRSDGDGSDTMQNVTACHKTFVDLYDFSQASTFFWMKKIFFFLPEGLLAILVPRLASPISDKDVVDQFNSLSTYDLVRWQLVCVLPLSLTTIVRAIYWCHLHPNKNERPSSAADVQSRFPVLKAPACIRLRKKYGCAAVIAQEILAMLGMCGLTFMFCYIGPKIPYINKLLQAILPKGTSLVYVWSCASQM